LVLPEALSENDERDASARQILLIAEILVGSYEDFKSVGLRCRKKLTVVQTFPADGCCFDDLVSRQMIA